MFKFLIFFNLLTFGSESHETLSREVSHSFKAGGCLLLMSYFCVSCFSELTEKVDDQRHGTNKAGLDWFGFVNTKLILQP